MAKQRKSERGAGLCWAVSKISPSRWYWVVWPAHIKECERFMEGHLATGECASKQQAVEAAKNEAGPLAQEGPVLMARAHQGWHFGQLVMSYARDYFDEGLEELGKVP